MLLLRALSAALPVALASCSALATLGIRVDENEVVYHVDLTRPHTQTLDVTLTLPTRGVESEEVMLPTWRPGRYTILNPASTVLQVRATDADGGELDIEKTSKSAWRVETGGSSEVNVHYRVYANSIGDRTRHVDPTHAFLSGSAVFFYAPRLRSAPVRVVLDLPEGWGVASGLETAPGEERTLVADDYDVLVDSPIEAGEHDRISFDVDGKAHEIVIWPAGTEHDADRMVEDFSAIIRAHHAIFGSYPYDRYVFLVHAGAGGGGTEHLNSTIMQTSLAAVEGSVDGSSSYERFLSLVSHEFFHTWNVKQLRPAGIHPYDYQRENYTDLLWVAEGSTSYYTALTLVRAGLDEPSDYLRSLGSAADRGRKSAAERVTSVASASWDSWISSFNPNTVNTRVDFYGKGSRVSLCLDLEIRRRTNNAVSYDTVLRTLYERFPLSGTGFTTEDLVSVANELTESSFEEFFERYVSGTEPLPYEDVLGVVGLQFTFEPEDDELELEEGAVPVKPYLGLRLSSEGSGSGIRSLMVDAPVWESGLVVGDELIALDGKRLTPGSLDDLLEGKQPGDTVTVHYLREDELRTIEIALGGQPAGKWVIEHVEEPTDAQKEAYRSWCGAWWPGDEPEEEADAEGEAEDAPKADG